MAQDYRAIAEGTKDYVVKSGFKEVILGLSGGIDEGPQIRSMNPDSQGLSYLFNRVKKT